MAILVALLALFILPSLRSGPHQLPVGIVGTPEAVAVAHDQLADLMPDAFAIQPVASAEALQSAIRARQVVGGLILADTGMEALVASAGSTAISGALGAAANQLSKSLDLPLTITDLVPLPPDDPQGIGIGGLTFPLVFGGIVPVVAFNSVFPRRNGWRLAGIAMASVASGLIVAAVLQFWFGSIVDAFWPVAAAMTLGIAAMALPLAGLQKAFGGAGFTIGAMAMMFLGNPLAGMGTTGAWLPEGLGIFGQLLPPGATGSLVRSAAYFDWAGSFFALNTLVVWLIIGAALTLIGIGRNRDLASSEQ